MLSAKRASPRACSHACAPPSLSSVRSCSNGWCAQRGTARCTSRTASIRPRSHARSAGSRWLPRPSILPSALAPPADTQHPHADPTPSHSAPPHGVGSQRGACAPRRPTSYRAAVRVRRFPACDTLAAAAGAPPCSDSTGLSATPHTPATPANPPPSIAGGAGRARARAAHCQAT